MNLLADVRTIASDDYGDPDIIRSRQVLAVIEAVEEKLEAIVRNMEDMDDRIRSLSKKI